MEAAFTTGFAEGRDIGAAVAVVVDRQLVVDLWGGHRDRRKTQPWERDTLCCLFSASKGITALCVLQAVAEGKLMLDEPLAEVWPGFGVNGKEAVTLRQVLDHQAGLIGFHEPVSAELLYDWSAVCSALERESPWWEPGTLHGYHARTFGFLLGEALRLATGSTPAGWLADRLAIPHALDLHFGLAGADLDRCAQMVPARVQAGSDATPESSRDLIEAMRDPKTPTGAAFQNPSMGPGYMNSERFRRAEMPAMNGHGTARDLATLYARMPELLPDEVLREATTTQSSGADQVLKSFTRFGLGFMLYDDRAPIGVRPGSFGHAGAGGSMAFYDPDARVGFCFVMNQMQQGVVTGGASAIACAEAAYACLE